MNVHNSAQSYSVFELIYRRAIQKVIDDEYDRQRAELKSLLSCVDSVSLTMDIWSDSTMRGFLGLTAHIIDTGTNKLISRVLDVPRFKGKLTPMLLLAYHYCLVICHSWRN